MENFTLEEIDRLLTGLDASESKIMSDVMQSGMLMVMLGCMARKDMSEDEKKVDAQKHQAKLENEMNDAKQHLEGVKEANVLLRAKLISMKQTIRATLKAGEPALQPELVPAESEEEVLVTPRDIDG